jgi:hypothetical protein
MSGDPLRRDTRRRFEQWARNPSCEANTLSAVHGIPMAEVAKREGLTPTMGQSPFAIARGQTFERGLFRESAKSLREALEEAGVLPAGSTGFEDLRMRNIGGRMRDLDGARSTTTELLKRIALGGRDAQPSIIASPTLLIPAGVMLPEALLVIDVAVVTDSPIGVLFTVGEIKTYPDRGGHTEPVELATARAQAGVYVHALRMVLKQLGIDERMKVSDKGFLVLSRPGFNRPSVRANEDLKYQAWRAERGFQQLEAAAHKLPPLVGEDRIDPGRLDAVRRSETAYTETCVSFCDLAPLCFDHALSESNPIVLGEDVARFLGATDLDRAMQLMDGASPASLAEEDLSRRLVSAH